MRLDQAEKLATQITEEAGIPASVLHVEDGAAPPYGYVVEADKRRFSSSGQWMSRRMVDAGTPSEKPYLFALRLAPELEPALRELASRNHRSINSEIEYAIQSHIERQS